MDQWRSCNMDTSWAVHKWHHVIKQIIRAKLKSVSLWILLKWGIVLQLSNFKDGLHFTMAKWAFLVYLSWSIHSYVLIVCLYNILDRKWPQNMLLCTKKKIEGMFSCFPWKLPTQCLFVKVEVSKSHINKDRAHKLYSQNSTILGIILL
mgnify:CR=1 FL=1